VILMEYNNTIMTDLSLLNHFKTFKQVQVVEIQGQSLAKVLVEDRNHEQVQW